jgi:hypothetical protein
MSNGMTLVVSLAVIAFAVGMWSAWHVYEGLPQ